MLFTGMKRPHVTKWYLPTPIKSSLSQEHAFVKPNDERALLLMDHAARDVMDEFKDIVLAFGESDEYRYFRYPSCLVWKNA